MSAQSSAAQENNVADLQSRRDNPASQPTPEAPKKRRTGRIALMAVVPLALVGAGAYFWLNGGRYEETDNAYVHQAKVSISADISGRITTVSVADNQSVKAGDVLFTLDPAPFQIALDQANAALSNARVGVAQLRAAYHSAQSGLSSARLTLDLQQAAYDRQAALVDKAVASGSSLDQPKLTLQQAQNAVVSSEQQVATTLAALGGNADIATDDHPSVRAAMAAVDLAERNMSKTTVMAPSDGTIGQTANINVGQFVSAGTAIASLFETQSVWVDANFKETQLGSIQIGMPVEVKLDAYPDLALEAHVASISAGTGSEFALIPAQNATGNWVKVVQRVPVRVEFDNREEQALLRSGMSAVVSVDTGKSTLDKMQGN